MHLAVDGSILRAVVPALAWPCLSLPPFGTSSHWSTHETVSRGNRGSTTDASGRLGRGDEKLVIWEPESTGTVSQHTHNRHTVATVLAT